MRVKRSFPRTQNSLLYGLIIGDAVFAFLGLSAGYWLRFETPLRSIGVSAEAGDYAAYQPLLLIGTIFLVGTFAYLKVYDGRLLLRPHRTLTLLLRGTLFWFAAFLGTSLVLKFEPAISRIFVAASCVTCLTTIGIWRLGFHRLLQASRLRERLVQRVVVVGWTEEAAALVAAIREDHHHPYTVLGYVATKRPPDRSSERGCDYLGSLANLESILIERDVDIAIVVDFELPPDTLTDVANLCERLYVQFKILPSFFRIFVSSLKLQTVSGVPVLGIEDLAITQPFNAALKRTVDIIGACVGLALSAPVMAILALFIRRESPGSVLYRQVRTGRDGRPFTILKLRSMRLDAEASGAQWAVASDPRRLRIGAFMRENNLDELPQFWNVLVGDMSLVGPRPERPELIAQFAKEIPHYNPRHEVRPGITGWAQVNGLRGNTSLVDRIKYDLFYIENWSIWFDVQILFLTLLKNKNAY
jgi:exopolysaccharide biosynthesis polyprenyl glycosylphosphotransferase